MSRVRPLSCAAGAALALLLAACSSEAPPAPPPPEVTIVTVRTQAVPNVIELPGRVQAYRTSVVRAPVNGHVARRLFDAGSTASAGTPLLTTSPTGFIAAANVASPAPSRRTDRRRP